MPFTPAQLWSHAKIAIKDGGIHPDLASSVAIAFSIDGPTFASWKLTYTANYLAYSPGSASMVQKVARYWTRPNTHGYVPWVDVRPNNNAAQMGHPFPPSTIIAVPTYFSLLWWTVAAYSITILGEDPERFFPVPDLGSMASVLERNRERFARWQREWEALKQPQCEVGQSSETYIPRTWFFAMQRLDEDGHIGPRDQWLLDEWSWRDDWVALGEGRPSWPSYFGSRRAAAGWPTWRQPTWPRGVRACYQLANGHWSC